MAEAFRRHLVLSGGVAMALGLVKAQALAAPGAATTAGTSATAPLAATSRPSRPIFVLNSQDATVSLRHPVTWTVPPAIERPDEHARPYPPPPESHAAGGAE